MTPKKERDMEWQCKRCGGHYYEDHEDYVTCEECGWSNDGGYHTGDANSKLPPLPPHIEAEVAAARL